MPECCQPCPAPPAGSGGQGRGAGGCPCKSCCCGKPPIITPCYKQPKVPASYAPRRVYMKPTAPVEGCTTYKLSYLPVECKNLRGEARKPTGNIIMSCAPMEGCTIQKLSYLPNEICVTNPIRPCNHDMWGQGPMQSLTTQRHDFVPKPSCVRESFKPDPKYHCVEAPFENRTINRMSYLDPGRQAASRSYAPTKCYEKPTAPMECATTHKMSYLPTCVAPPQRPPWACKGQYQKPCQRFDGTTVYQGSFLPPGMDCSEVQDPCSYGDCNPCPCKCPAECISKDPCACDFPKAACC